MRKIDDIKIGEKANVKHLVTIDDIKKFAELTGDDNRLHVDEEFAKKTAFKKTVAHGMLGASFISTVIGTKLPGDGSLWYSQTLEFLLPVRIGDEITVEAEVVGKSESHGIIELTTNVFNSAGQTVIKGCAKVKLLTEEEVEKNDETSCDTDSLNTRKQVALVIGASGGIGRATALKLAQKGFDVIVHYHSKKEVAKNIASEIAEMKSRAIIVSADICDGKSVDEMFAEIGRYFENIDVLVNCSTIRLTNIKFEKMEWADIESHVNVNLKGCFNLVKRVLPGMKINKKGSIINVITQAVESPVAENAHYIAGKAALNGFSRALAFELAPMGIRVNNVSPGMTETELIADVPEKTRLVNKAKTPLRRLATADDVASAICFLAGDEASYLAGETIRVNGGQVML